MGGRGQHGDVSQRGGSLAQAGHLGLAVEAPRKVLLEGGALVVVEGIDDVGTGQRVQRLGHCPTPIVSRRRMSPSLILVLAVPSGRSSMVATSVWV